MNFFKENNDMIREALIYSIINITISSLRIGPLTMIERVKLDKKEKLILKKSIINNIYILLLISLFTTFLIFSKYGIRGFFTSSFINIIIIYIIYFNYTKALN